MRVVQVAPTAFGNEGLYGGGERYPLELARALARVDGVDSELVTFGKRSRVERDPDGFVVRVLAPWALGRGHPAHPLTPALIGALAGADIVHTHHLRSAPSRIAAVLANMRGQHLVTTDHGLGGGGWWGALPRLFDRFLTVSRVRRGDVAGPFREGAHHLRRCRRQALRTGRRRTAQRHLVRRTCDAAQGPRPAAARAAAHGGAHHRRRRTLGIATRLTPAIPP